MFICCFFWFRGILYPLRPRLEMRYILITCVIVFVCSVALQGYVFTKYSFSAKIHIIANVTVQAYTCRSNFTVEEKFIKSIFQFSIGFWIPMVLTMVCHFLMYKKLRTQTIFRRNSSSSINSNLQMKRITVKFVVIICAFYTCILPLTIVETYATYQKYKGLTILSPAQYHMILSLCTLLMDFNSCINPLIYANLHVRLLSGVRWIFNFQACFKKLLAPCVEQNSVEITSEKNITSETSVSQIRKKDYPMVELKRYSWSAS